jgi:hypothetical protein
LISRSLGATGASETLGGGEVWPDLFTLNHESKKAAVRQPSYLIFVRQQIQSNRYKSLTI